KRTDINLFNFLKRRCQDFDAYAIGEKGIHIWVTQTEDIPSGTIKTDEDLLEEVIYILLDSAIKYSYNAARLKKDLGLELKDGSYRSDGNMQACYSKHYSRPHSMLKNSGLLI